MILGILIAPADLRQLMIEINDNDCENGWRNECFADRLNSSLMNITLHVRDIKQLVVFCFWQELLRVIISDIFGRIKTMKWVNFVHHYNDHRHVFHFKWNVKSHFSLNYSHSWIFFNSLKAYHIIKTKLKSLFRLSRPREANTEENKEEKKYFDGNEWHDVKIKV